MASSDYPPFEGTYTIAVPVTNTKATHSFPDDKALKGVFVTGFEFISRARKNPKASAEAAVGSAGNAANNTFVTLQAGGKVVMEDFPLNAADPHQRACGPVRLNYLDLDLNSCKVVNNAFATDFGVTEVVLILFYYVKARPRK
jgi:hypothetical protein